MIFARVAVLIIVQSTRPPRQSFQKSPKRPAESLRVTDGVLDVLVSQVNLDNCDLDWLGRNPYCASTCGELKVEFLGPSRGFNAEYSAEMTNASPYTFPRCIGRIQFFSGGAFTTDFLRWLLRDEQLITLEEAHYGHAADGK